MLVIEKRLRGASEATFHRLHEEIRALRREAGVVPFEKVYREEGAIVLIRPTVEGEALPHRMAEPQALQFAVDVLDALAGLHRHGVVHRHISAGNLIHHEGRWTLLDIGLPERTDVWPTDTLRTLSPEQLGLLSVAVDARSDLYAVGVILYELLSGPPLYRVAERSELFSEVLSNPPPPLRRRGVSVSKPFDELVLRLLQAEPGRRYQTAEGALADVLQIQAGSQVVIGAYDRRSTLTQSAYVGREAELAAAMQGGDVTVNGEPGVGRRRFLEELSIRRPQPSGAPLSVDLKPLSDRESRAMAHSMAGPMADDILDRIVAAAQGNPYLIRASLQALVDAGALRAGPAGWELNEGAGPSSLPWDDGLLQVPRIDLLSDTTRYWLSAAAVLGMEFDMESAHQVAESTPDGTQDLHHLVHIASGRGRFRHSRIRTALLDRLEREQRRHLYERAVGFLHQEKAYEVAALLDWAGRHGEALPHALQAAAAFEGSQAWEDAESMYRIALKALDEGPWRDVASSAGPHTPPGAEARGAEREHLLLGLGTVLLRLGKLQEARHWLSQCQAPAARLLSAEATVKTGDLSAAAAVLIAALEQRGWVPPRGLWAIQRALINLGLGQVAPRHFDVDTVRPLVRLSDVAFLQNDLPTSQWAEGTALYQARALAREPGLEDAVSETWGLPESDALQARRDGRRSQLKTAWQPGAHSIPPPPPAGCRTREPPPLGGRAGQPMWQGPSGDPRSPPIRGCASHSANYPRS